AEQRRVRRLGRADPVRRWWRAALPAPLPGGARGDRVPAAVRGRDRGVRPAARYPRPTTRDDRQGRRRVHHPRAGKARGDSEEEDDIVREDVGMTTTAHPELEGLGKYQWGWHDSDEAGAKARRGLSEEIVREISAMKDEPE